MVGCAWDRAPNPPPSLLRLPVGLSHEALACSWWQPKAGLGHYSPQDRSGKGGPWGGVGGSCLPPVV